MSKGITVRRNRRPKPSPLCYVEPAASDIRCGRGPAVTRTTGFKMFRCIISRYCELYRTSPCFERKAEIVDAVQDEIHEKRARVVRKDDVGWYVVSEVEAREKIRAALREYDSG